MMKLLSFLLIISGIAYSCCPPSDGHCKHCRSNTLRPPQNAIQTISQNRNIYQDSVIPPLIAAAKEGNIEMVKVLLQQGVNVDLVYPSRIEDQPWCQSWNSQCKTALEWAKEKGHIEIVRLLETYAKNKISKL